MTDSADPNYRYSVQLDNSLTENEFVYAYFGISEEKPVSNPNEVEEWKWEHINVIRENINDFPDEFTYWFKFSFNELYEFLNS